MIRPECITPITRIMKTFKKIVPPVVSFFFILLFIYASASKMLDFENFQVQLAQSPLLSAYAGFISYGVIILELVIVGLLCFNLTRLWGLYASFAIMVAFTVYIFLILNYSDFVPCSCGGILEKMGWTEHLIFNTACVVTAGLAAIAAHPFPPKAPIREVTEDEWMANYWQRRKERRMIAYKMAALLVLPASLMIVLFLSSEYIMKKENNFTRRFLPHAIIEHKAYHLDNEFFYFAGFSTNRLYLGNILKPLELFSIDENLSDLKQVHIQLDQSNHLYRRLKYGIYENYFYLYDGSVPIIYRGKLGEDKATTVSYNDIYFDQLSIIGPTQFILRIRDKNTKEHNIALLNKDSSKTKIKTNSSILQKQIDGVFDTDGTLAADEKGLGIAYMYTYRNQFITFNDQLSVKERLNTIDTTTHANISTQTLQNGIHKMTKPPVKVNKNIAYHHQIIFNESNIRGRHESRKNWNNASVIDLYRSDKQEYLGSFYIYQRNGNRLSQMLVTDKNIYLLYKNEIVVYRIAHAISRYFQIGEAENL